MMESNKASLYNCFDFGQEKKQAMALEGKSKQPLRSVLDHLPRGSTVDIRFENVTYSVPDKKNGLKTILKSVNGEFRSGELTAIMGPSGAGKSSLMNILAGFNVPHVTGNILINGVERDLRSFKKLSCYIMQRDELCPHLSVMELMMFAANLKIGNQMSPADKQLVVNEILEIIGLKATVNTRTSRLSGGETKRLAIALELVNNPPVMFFDEPTSGLDSSSCLQCISLMKKLAQGGRTVICVIHQPSSSLFELFDHLYMVAEGQCIYKGFTHQLIRFLSTLGLHCPSYHNPADFGIDVATGKYGYVINKMVEAAESDQWNERSIVKEPLQIMESNGAIHKKPDLISLSIEDSKRKFSLAADYDERETAQYRRPASFWTQFALMLHKTVICILRDRTLTGVRLSVHVVIGLLAGLLYLNIGNEASKVFSNAGSLIFGQLFLMATAMMTTVVTFPLEMPVLVREHLNNWYNLKAYYLAKSVADLPFQIGYPAIYIVIVYLMSDQPLEAHRFLMYMSMGILTSLVAQSVGLVIGAALNLQTAVFLGTATTAPLFLFSGFFVTFSAVPQYLRWLCYTVYVRYGFEGTMLSVYGFDRPHLECADDYCHFKSPMKFLKSLDVEESMYWIDVAALVAFFFIIRFATFFVLRWKICSRV